MGVGAWGGGSSWSEGGFQGLHLPPLGSEGMRDECGSGWGAGPGPDRMALRPTGRWKQFLVTWGRAELPACETRPQACAQEAARSHMFKARCRVCLCLFKDAGARGQPF